MPRHVFDGNRLSRDAARLAEHDRVAPPEARPSLMGVVRTFADYIETRAQLGWTDPMIAALLTEAGYPITAATLRSYRKRLRDERGDAVQRTGADPPRSTPAVATRPAVPEPLVPAPPLPVPTPAKAMPPAPLPAPAMPSASAKSASPPTPVADTSKRTFSIRNNRPPDRA